MYLGAALPAGCLVVSCVLATVHTLLVASEVRFQSTGRGLRTTADGGRSAEDGGRRTEGV